MYWISTVSLPINLEYNQRIGSAGVIFLREHLNMYGNKITEQCCPTWKWLPVTNIKGYKFVLKFKILCIYAMTVYK